MASNASRPALASFMRKTAFLFSLLSILSFSQFLQAAPPKFSSILPKAQKSLLLDIKAAGERLVVVGERGHILYSDDHGKSWTQAKVPSLQMLTAVSFINAQEGWAVGHDGVILHSLDGGTNWEIQRDGLENQKKRNLEQTFAIRDRIKSIEAAIKSNGDAGVIEDLKEQLDEAKMDLEEAEELVKEPVSTPPLMDVLFTSEREGWTVGAFGQFLHSLDGGKSWESYAGRIDNPDDLHLNALAAGADGEVFIVGEAGLNFRTLDGGESWEMGDLPYDGSLFKLTGTADGTRLLTFGLRGNAFLSEDKGLTWKTLDTSTDSTLSGVFLAADGGVIAVGSGGTVTYADNVNGPFSSYQRADRLGLSAVIKVSKDQYLAVGMGGVHQLTLPTAESKPQMGRK